MEIGELRFLYIGVDDTDAAVERYTTAMGGVLRWRFRHFGADVAGITLGTGPLVLLADHRPTGSVLPIWAVTDLDQWIARLATTQWTVSGPMGTPEGDAILLTGPDGGELAFLDVVRRDAMDGAYADPDNTHRV